MSSDAKPTPGQPQIKDSLARPLPKRFYKDATTAPRDGAHVVLLDGRTAKTPGKAVLAVPTPQLAAALAAEWHAQSDVIDPATMPLTRFVNTAIDGVARRAREVAADVVKYAGSDLLCYRADHPQGLVERQSAAWDPVLGWARDELGANFVLAEGVMPVAQPAPALARIAAAVDPLPPLRLTALHVMTTLMGSALLALAVERGRLSPAAAWAAAHVDEDWQISQWGEDAEATARRAVRWADMQAAARLLELVD